MFWRFRVMLLQNYSGIHPAYLRFLKSFYFILFLTNFDELGFWRKWFFDKNDFLTNRRLTKRLLTKKLFDETSFDEKFFGKTSFDETSFDETSFDEKTWYHAYMHMSLTNAHMYLVWRDSAKFRHVWKIIWQKMAQKFPTYIHVHKDKCFEH
jgi:hypothetical protein